MTTKKIVMAAVVSAIGLGVLGGTAKADEDDYRAPVQQQVRWDQDGDRGGYGYAGYGYGGYGYDGDGDRWRDHERMEHEWRERMEHERREHQRRWFRGWDRF